MKRLLANNWDMVLVRGIVAVLFGIATLFLPGITLIVLVALFGGYALVDGVISIIVAIKDRKETDNWWLMVLFGLVSIAAGVLTFAWPGITAISLFYVIVAWAIVSGVFEVILAIQLRKEIEGEWLMVLSGLVSVALGILLMTRPAVGLLTVLWMIGIGSIAYGVLLTVLSFQMRDYAVTDNARLTNYHQAQQS
jgi:uncharacterized membrane protein HdeD (DUF308 family)